MADAALRAAIYVRVSSDPRQRWRSVTEQEAECRTFAQKQGWQVAAVFCDNDRSASRYAKTTRPDFARLQRFIAAGSCDVVLTWEGSRGQRDLAVFVEVRDLLERYGVLWSYDGDVLDMRKARDRKRAAEDAIDAEYEVDRGRERVLRAMRANAAAGKPHGKIPYGYRREYDPATRELLAQVPDPAQAAVVRECARRFLAGETLYAIAIDLNLRSIPAPRSDRWTSTQVRRIVTLPRMVGRRSHRQPDGSVVLTEAEWEPILDEATWQRCVARLSDPARRKVRDTTVRYLLSGIARCGVCDGPIFSVHVKGQALYRCRDRFCVGRNIAKVDDQITRLLLARLALPDAASVFARDDADISAVLDTLAERRARLDGFYDAAADGEITPKALARIESKLLAEIDELEASVRSADAPPALYDLASDPTRVWKGLGLTQQREVVRWLLDVRILRTKRGSRNHDPESVRVVWRGSSGALPAARS